jgi:hypothetical protein
MIYLSIDNSPDVKYPDDEIGAAMERLAFELDNPDVGYVVFEYVKDCNVSNGI